MASVWILSVQLIISSLFLILPIRSQYIEPLLCISKCLCLPQERAVACHENDNMRALPTNIKKSITRFIVQRGTFDKPSLYRHNLTGLEHLTFLKIIYYNLKYIGPRAFIKMEKLQYLDLSHNQMINIASLAFSGLSLMELHIMENFNIKFQANAFYNMTSFSINMRSNNLSDIRYELMKNTRVKYLYLYNNRIATIDPRFQSLFNGTKSLLDVSNNPLICDCSLSWLADVLSKRFPLKKTSIESKKINISCSGPAELHNKQLMFLTADELRCSPLRINTVHLHFDHETPQLTCVSRVGGSKPPVITWLYYVDDYEKNSIKGKTVEENSKDKHLQSITLAYNTINLTKNYFKNGRSRLICIASANNEIVQRLEIHIQRLYRFSMTVASNHSVQMSTTVPEKSFLFVKHFSLLEMLAAVLGTFTATFVGLLVLLRYLRAYKDKIMKKSDVVDMHRSMNSIKPYWYVSQGNGSTYSMPNSHPEYENPATLDNIRDLTNMYSSYTTSKTGFLDFKTLNPILT